jgi:diguanylate cyclase (GGDEF)-like protein/hemerythrin-like metal-binding protein
MDTRTLTITLVFVTAALAFLMVLLAIYRRQRSLTIYAGGFVGGMAGFLLILGPGTMTPWFSVLAANTMLMFSYACLPWGLRTTIGWAHPWARRYWVYVAAWCLAELAVTFVWTSYPLRAATTSLVFILWAGEFIAGAWAARNLPRIVRAAALATAAAFIAGHVVRLVLLQGLANAAGLSALNNGLAPYTFLFSAVSSILWAGVILIIEVARLLGSLEETNAALRAMAHTDELTGLSNRHRLDQAMTAEKDRCLRYGLPLSLILFDLDHFKQVNDNWGHPVGDAVLKRSADVVREQIRGPDSLFRWGGEEFMLLVPQTPLDGAAVLAEKLRTALESASFPNDLTVTASFGVAEWWPPESNESWIEKVDLALYRAKNSGRNRVEAWQLNDKIPVARVQLEWREEWESGNALVDGEHRRLVELANGLMEVTLANRPLAVVARQLDELVVHVADHFDHEEKLLAEIDYPGLTEHAALHGKLLDEARFLRHRFDRGEADASTFFQFLVSQVVVGHILAADTRYFTYTRRGRPA